MENEENGKPEKEETEIEALARIVNAGFDRMDNQFADLRNETKADFAAVNKRIDGAQQALGYRIDQLDAKMEKHRQEAKTEHAALRVVGGISHTLADHEERLKELEGE